MTEIKKEIEMNTPNDTYQKLDRAALWLIFGEVGGAALM